MKIAKIFRYSTTSKGYRNTQTYNTSQDKCSVKPIWLSKIDFAFKFLENCFAITPLKKVRQAFKYERKLCLLQEIFFSIFLKKLFLKKESSIEDEIYSKQNMKRKKIK